MSSLWKKAPLIVGYLVSSVSQMRATLDTSQSAGCVSRTSTSGKFLTTDSKPFARPCAPVWPRAPWVITMVPLPPMAVTRAWVIEAPMNSLSGARKVWTLIESSGAISVSRSMTGVPLSIIFWTGAVSVPMPKAWIATKSQSCDAMLSIAARCLTASSWPSNQVTSTLKSLPQYSAAALPCAHQLACRPALENAAFSGFSERPETAAASAAKAGLMPMPPKTAAAAAAEPVTVLMKSRRDCGVTPNFSVISLSLDGFSFLRARQIPACRRSHKLYDESGACKRKLQAALPLARA